MNRGFTLLEIILALAILAGSLAALGEVLRLSDQNAALARDETQAQILASSVMDELLAGVRMPASVSGQTFDLDADPPWIYSINVEPTERAAILRIHVRVEQQMAPQLQPAYYDLYRWMLNPEAIPLPASSGSAGGLL